MEVKIVDTDILDHNSNYEDPMPSMISVVVTAEVNGKSYWLDYQTSETMDVGAYSSNMVAYNDTEWDRLRDDIDDDDEFYKLLSDVADQADVQKKWREYVSKNYELDDSYFGGLDASSEINSAKPRHGGARPGAGRKPVGGEIRKPRAIRLSDTEYEAVKKFLAGLRDK